jgi:quercetin dioxygenase-like cupin family protein
MKTSVFALAALGAWVASAAAQPAAKKPVPVREVKVMAQADLKWETDPESKVSIAVLSGNPKTGPYEAFVKFPAGMDVPLHWHTFSNTAVGVSGTLVVDVEGQGTKEIAAGSWGLLPGRVKHTTKCKEGADCVIYGRQPGKDDIHLVNPPPKK